VTTGFERLYRANVDVVTAYFARRTADPQLVADLTADTFVAVITYFGSFDPRKGTARAWVFGIARSVYASYCEANSQQQHKLRRLAGASCLAVAGTAAALVASGGSPAYAVTKNPNGTVTLDVYQKSGIAGANAKPHQLGDNVVVVPAGVGCPSIRSLPAPAVPAARGSISTQTGVSKGGSVTVNAHGIPAGDILVVAVETTTNGRTTTSLGAGKLTSPPAPSCVSLPATPPPPGNGGGSGG
jgi:hypothetical protein